MQRAKRVTKVGQIKNLTEKRRACDRHCADRAANSPLENYDVCSWWWRLRSPPRGPFVTVYCAFLKTYTSFRVVGQRRRHVDHFRFLLSFSTAACDNRAYSTCSNFASLGSWKFRSMLLSIRRGPLSFFASANPFKSRWRLNALFRRRRRNKNFSCTSVNLILYHTHATDVVTATICCCV